MFGLKTVIGEYGKMIILAVILCSFTLFIFGKDPNGFLGMLGRAKPIESVGHKGAFAEAEAIASRTAPELSVSVEKLKRSREYDLLDAEMFGIKAVNEDGEKVKVLVTRIISPIDEDVTGSAVPQRFVPIHQGAYHITYRAEENYLGSKKTRDKEYCFIAD